MEKEIDLKLIYRLIINHIRFVIATTILCALIGFIFVKFFIPPKYESSVSLYVNSTANTGSSLNINDINASQKLVNTYIVIIKDDEVLKSVSEELIKQYDLDYLSKYINVYSDNGVPYLKTSDLRSLINLSAVDNTEVLRVQAITKNAELSAKICELIAEIAPKSIQRIVNAGSVEKLGEPQVAKQKYSPSTIKFTLGPALAGLILSIIFIYVKHTLDNTVKEEEDLREKLSVPVIGEIPDFKFFENNDKNKKNSGQNSNSTNSKKDVCVSSKTPFGIVEAYKSMRTNIIYSIGARKNKVIVVTSSGQGEGKSTTCANLAITLAQTTAKVVLIDADMRRPTLHKIFGLKNKEGLSNIIIGLSEFKNVMNKNVRDNLDVITAGVIPPNPTELLSSDRMSGIVDVLKKYYDYIIIDTPPVNVVSDTLGVTYDDTGLILVVKQNSTTYDEARAALEKIKISNTQFLGCIINLMDHGDTLKSKKSYKNYKYSYRENE